MLIFQVNNHYKLTYIDEDKTFKIKCKVLEVRDKDIVVEWNQLGKGWRSRMYGLDVLQINSWIKFTSITECEEL